MHRLAARLVIAGMALAVGVAAAGCSAAPGLAYAQGATRPASYRVQGRHRDGAGVRAGEDRASGPGARRRRRPKGVKAKAGILVDATTGQVLWAEGENTERPIASITKVMTALVILQAGGLNRKLAVPKAVTAYVAKYGANAAGLIPGRCSLSTSCCTRC